ncbi:MAG TPA: hypothetical protein IAD13_02450 [Bacteroidetes bacterium]|nr:hypothetical protein [Candidatus Limimorpha avicola]
MSGLLTGVTILANLRFFIFMIYNGLPVIVSISLRVISTIQAPGNTGLPSKWTLKMILSRFRWTLNTVSLSFVYVYKEFNMTFKI